MSISSLLYLLFVSVIGITASLLLPLSMCRLRIFIGPALGAVIVTELILVLSLMIGFSPLSIWLAMIILVFLVVLLKTRPITPLPPITLLSRIKLRHHWPLFFTLLTIGSVVFYVFWTKILTPTPSGLVTGGEGLYGDTALHAAYTMAIVEQGLPPTNPLFARIPLIYPFLVNLFSASLVKLGMNLRFAFILPQLLYFLGFTTLFYWITKKIYMYHDRDNIFPGKKSMGDAPEGSYDEFHLSERHGLDRVEASCANDLKRGMGHGRGRTHFYQHANLASFFTLLIFFLGWGLGFTQYFDTTIKTGDWSVTREYTNNLPGFNMHNVLVGLIFPERSYLPGLFIGMLITLLCLDQYVIANSTKSRGAGSGFARQSQPTNNNPSTYGRSAAGRQLITIGFLLGILPLWHMHTFLFFAVGIGVWYALLTPQGWVDTLPWGEGTKQLFNKLFPLFTIYGIAFLLSLPVFLWFSKQVSSDSFIHFTTGWLDSKTNPALFWFKNTGLLIPLAAFGIFKSLRHPGVPHLGGDRLNPPAGGESHGSREVKQIYWRFFLPALIIFFLANLVVFQPWDWDNIKLFSWVFLFFSIPAGYGLARLFSSSPPIRLIGLICLISLTLSGTLSLIHIAKGEFTIYDDADIELATWVKANTKPTDTFLIDPWPNHPIPGLSGRSVYLGYPGHLWVHGISYGEREGQVKKILTGDLSLVDQLETPISYILIEKNTTSLLANQSLREVYRNSKFTLYQVD